MILSLVTSRKKVIFDTELTAGRDGHWTLDSFS